MSNEMEPQIKELIARAEDGIELLKKREKSLKAKVRPSPCSIMLLSQSC